MRGPVGASEAFLNVLSETSQPKIETLRVQSFFEQPGFGESGISVAFNTDSKISFVLFVFEWFDKFFEVWERLEEGELVRSDTTWKTYFRNKRKSAGVHYLQQCQVSYGKPLYRLPGNAFCSKTISKHKNHSKEVVSRRWKQCFVVPESFVRLETAAGASKNSQNNKY